jgi:hypothetical protein
LPRRRGRRTTKRRIIFGNVKVRSMRNITLFGEPIPCALFNSPGLPSAKPSSFLSCHFLYRYQRIAFVSALQFGGIISTSSNTIQRFLCCLLNSNRSVSF